MQRATAYTYRSMTHGRHQAIGSSCCLALREERGLAAEGGWLNSLSGCPGSHQQWILSIQIKVNTNNIRSDDNSSVLALL